MSLVIMPRSDQINADTLLAGPMTITVSAVSIKPGTEQPLTINYDGDDGKPWKPCKSMARVLVHCWGRDANQYIGRSLTLYCDPKVTWGGLAVGGIRISHMNHITSTVTVVLTATKGNKKPFVVKPLEVRKPAATAADWIANTLAPALAAAADHAAVIKAQQSKGYVSIQERGSDDDKAAVARLVAAALERIDGADDAGTVPADDDFAGDDTTTQDAAA
jgi:hypothetical protein